MATRNLILRGTLTTTDIQHLGADDEIPATGEITLPLVRWLALSASLTGRTDRVGVRVAPQDDVRQLAGQLDAAGLVAIEFPKFADGRGYSLARIVRDHLAYRGELRAVGQVLRDQIFYLHRCGFDAFEVPDDKSAASTMAGLRDFSVTYQAAADEPLPIYRR